MASVTLPVLFENETGGTRHVEVAGSSIAEIIAGLDAKYPGIGERMLQDGKLTPIVAFTLNGKIVADVQTTVEPAAEIRVYPSFGGG